MGNLIDRAREARLHDRIRETLGDATVVRAQRFIGPFFGRSLVWLARVYWTDKGGHHDYMPLYQRHFRALRRHQLTLLEIGIGGYSSATSGGASLRMWRDYFPRGEIHGLDIAEKRIAEPRIHVHRGDQSDTAYLRSLADATGPYNIIIDDGSHVADHIRTSFHALFDHLRPGGWYVIEDMATAYDGNYGGGPPGHPGTAVDLVKEMVDGVNARYAWSRAPTISEIHLYEEIAFIRRA